MFEKFEKTCLAWGIVIFPEISAVIVIVDKVINLGLEIDGTKNFLYVMVVLLISALVDIAAMTFIGALSYLYDEYERKDR